MNTGGHKHLVHNSVVLELRFNTILVVIFELLLCLPAISELKERCFLVFFSFVKAIPYLFPKEGAEDIY